MTLRSISACLASALLAALTFGPAHAQSPAEGLVSERSISADAALELALSDDGANPHTLENSERKAYTAFSTRGASGEVGKRPAANLVSFLQLDRTTGGEGGLPIFAGKEIVGAVGISGAPGGEKDAACAQAGIERIARKLGNG